MKLTLPKLSNSDLAGVSIIVSAGVFAGLHWGLRLDAVTAATVSAGVGGIIGIVVPAGDTALISQDVVNVAEDVERAIATKQIAAAIPQLGTDVLKLYGDYMTAHANAVVQTAPVQVPPLAAAPVAAVAAPLVPAPQLTVVNDPSQALFTKPVAGGPAV